jgi:hypothetical protein
MKSNRMKKKAANSGFYFSLKEDMELTSGLISSELITK